MIMTLAVQFQHLLAQSIPILPASGIDRTQPAANVAAVAETGVTGAIGKDSRPDDSLGAVAPLRQAPLDSPNTPDGSKSDVSRFKSGRTFQICPCLVLAEPQVNNVSAKLNDGEARESTHSKREPVAGPTLAAGNSIVDGPHPDPVRNLAWASVNVPESEYLETIIDAIELADTADDFRVIRAAISKVSGAVNRGSLRMMVELREKGTAHD